MNSQSIQVETSTIHTLANSMLADGKELINDLYLVKDEIDKFDICFNTPAGKIFKEKMLEYVEEKIKYIQENYLQYAVVVEKMAEAYDETKEANANDVNKEGV